jgi:hypothetical protein
VSQLRQVEPKALHISVDSEAARRLANDWMELGLSFLPLHIHEAEAPTLGASVKAVLRQEVADVGALTVVLPEFEHPRWWHPLLHRQSARQLAAELHDIRGVATVIVPFLAPNEPATSVVRSASRSV